MSLVVGELCVCGVRLHVLVRAGVLARMRVEQASLIVHHICGGLLRCDLLLYLLSFV